MLPKNLF